MTSITGPAATDPRPTADVGSTGRLGDRVFSVLSTGSGILVVVVIGAIATFLLASAIPSLRRNEASFLTERVWEVSSGSLRFGIADMLWVTVVSSLIAMALAVPLAIGVALFLTQYAPARLARPFAAAVDLLAAVPSIVFGIWGYFVLREYVTPVQGWISSAFGWFPLFGDETVSGTIFLAGVVLAIMILPIVTAISREVFDQTPSTHKEAALALGATKWEMIRTAVLPFGRPGVISASMLGLGRALGETIAVLLIISSVRGQFSWSVFSGGETFASRIARDAGEFDSPDKTGAYIAAGLVLFLLTFAVNAVARVVIERRKAFSE